MTRSAAGGGVGGPPALELDQVTFGYGPVPVLREVGLRVRPGEFVALVGGNGAGKSTLVQLALGLLRPTHGWVRLFGVDATRFSARWDVGYVPQRAGAATTLPVNVEEAVRSGLAGRRRLGRRLSGEQRARLDHVLDLQGLAAVRRRPVAELSGGQQQRVLLARALATAPRLLVLDEPTTGVDAAARAVLRDSLEHLVRVEGMAVVYVSHDPEGFAGLADRVVEVRAGRLAAVPLPAAPADEAARR